MVKTLHLGLIIFVAFLTESLSQRSFWRTNRRPSISEDSIDQRLFPVPYEETSKHLFKSPQDERREIEESRPLCEEERRSLEVRDLIYMNPSTFIQSGTEFDLRKYNFLPRKIDVIKCVSNPSDDDSGAVCKPENCREQKVDIEVFGRLKNETGNVWEFVGTLSAVPIGCECFVRWKPHKCLRFPEF